MADGPKTQEKIADISQQLMDQTRLALVEAFGVKKNSSRKTGPDTTVK
jgi:hypothetical protein